MHQTSHSYLLDHQVKGAVVLPACLVLDWFTQCLLATAPATSTVEVSDFAILRGIRMANFVDDKTYQFYVDQTKLDRSNSYRMQLMTAMANKAICYYQATVQSCHEESEHHQTIMQFDHPHWPCSVSDIYSGSILFHGPALQVVQELLDYSTLGGRALLKSSRALAMTNPRWYQAHKEIDIALLDGGLQLAFVWVYLQSGRFSLPMKMSRIVYYLQQPVDESIYCEIQATQVDKLRSRFDLTYYSNNAEVVAKIFGLEMIAY